MSQPARFTDPALRRLALLIAALGLVPALIIGLTLRFEAGELVVANRSLGAYDLSQLTAGLISMTTPILLLIPLSLASMVSSRHSRYWFLAVCAPWLFLIPSVLVGILVGGSSSSVPIDALMAMGLLSLCFTLWLETLLPVLGKPITIIVYASVWAVSGFLVYVIDYVAPYLEMSLLDRLSVLTYLMPQLQSGPGVVDEAIQTGGAPWIGLLPTLIQIPLLGAWRIYRQLGQEAQETGKPAAKA